MGFVFSPEVGSKTKHYENQRRKQTIWIFDSKKKKKRTFLYESDFQKVDSYKKLREAEDFILLTTMVLFLTSSLLKDREDFSKIWLAAHWERKLKRYQIFKVDIEGSIKDMIDKNITLDLRLSGHLLIGLVKILSRKTKYLLNECSEIFFKVKIYKCDNGLPSNKMKACLKDITFPELKNVDEFFQVNCNEFEKYRSRSEDITLKEVHGNLAPDEDDFEIGPPDEKFSQELEKEILKSFEECKKDVKKLKKASNLLISVDIACDVDDNQDSENNDVFGDQEMMDVSDPSEIERKETVGRRASICVEPIPFHLELSKSSSEEELNLEPIPAFTKTTTRRKRKLIIDQVKVLDPLKLKKQLCNTSDIMIPFEMAPPTKRLMTLKKIGCAEKLFKLPWHQFGNMDILKLYIRNLKVHKLDESVSSCEEEPVAFPSPEQPRAVSDHNDLDECFEMNEMCHDNLVSERSRHGLGSFNMEEMAVENDDMDKFEPENIDYVQDQVSFEDSQDLEKRMATMLSNMQESLRRNNKLKFSEMVKYEKRMKVARKFQAILMLKKLSAIELKQAKPYEEIFITKGMNFSPACSQLF